MKCDDQWKECLEDCGKRARKHIYIMDGVALSENLGRTDRLDRATALVQRHDNK